MSKLISNEWKKCLETDATLKRAEIRKKRENSQNSQNSQKSESAAPKEEKPTRPSEEDVLDHCAKLVRECRHIDEQPAFAARMVIRIFLATLWWRL